MFNQSIKVITEKGKLEICNSANGGMMTAFCVILNKMYDAGLFKDSIKGFTIEAS